MTDSSYPPSYTVITALSVIESLTLDQQLNVARLTIKRLEGVLWTSRAGVWINDDDRIDQEWSVLNREHEAMAMAYRHGYDNEKDGLECGDELDRFTTAIIQFVSSIKCQRTETFVTKYEIEALFEATQAHLKDGSGLDVVCSLMQSNRSVEESSDSNGISINAE
ncbi:hypothetical protein EW146_g9494 [Bondarzewia mesenterica]|uniref:Uncharacterized protein n=1 Tax=Bondarzewia mesenterica TaxID=1095465 RepID=A0A4S4L774_9AGAM|nr:hypothetical protein EW146_g9494 [Bondarzewia mesenterica]